MFVIDIVCGTHATGFTGANLITELDFDQKLQIDRVIVPRCRAVDVNINRDTRVYMSW